MKPWKRIILSRTDSIGDVVLTLPMAAIIKAHMPDAFIIALGRAYTQPIFEACMHIDAFEDWGSAATPREKVELLQRLQADAIFHVFPDAGVVQAASIAKIPHRIGTARRLHTLRKVNHRLFYSRKKSGLHEVQLNLKMLRVMGLPSKVALQDIAPLYGLVPQVNWTKPASRAQVIVLHPKSKGSALEWSIEGYAALIELMSNEPISFWITGTAAERELIGDGLPWGNPNVHDLTGKLSLPELIACIAEADALVACSTGPLHIAAALGKIALGLYTPKRPMHSGRWGPVGDHAIALSERRHPENGILTIPAQAVKSLLLEKMLDSGKYPRTTKK